MRADADPDLVLIERMLAPPPLAEARHSLDYWRTRRRTLPFYRRRARREAAEMAARWQARVRAAQIATFEASRTGRLLLALGVPRFWARLPEVDRRLVVAVAWRFVPPQVKLAAGVVAVAVLGIFVLVVSQLV